VNSLVLMRAVPDVVEELEIAADGKSLDRDAVRAIVCETDDHALEEALILKERHGGTVSVMALDADGVDDILYSALAKGADGAFKIATGEMAQCTRARAALFAAVIANHPVLRSVDLVLTGVQAIDDLDGILAPLVAFAMGRPSIDIVTSVVLGDNGKSAVVAKEFPSGVRGEFDLPLPAVIGIQASEKPPRYVPVTKLRNIMKTAKIESLSVPGGNLPSAPDVLTMNKPRVTSQAEMLDGTPEQISGKLVQLLTERGLL